MANYYSTFVIAIHKDSKEKFNELLKDTLDNTLDDLFSIQKNNDILVCVEYESGSRYETEREVWAKEIDFYGCHSTKQGDYGPYEFVGFNGKHYETKLHRESPSSVPFVVSVDQFGDPGPNELVKVKEYLEAKRQFLKKYPA